MTDNNEERCSMASHEDLCNDALKHYEEISSEATHWNSLVPLAIEYYRDNYVDGDDTPRKRAANAYDRGYEDGIEEGKTRRDEREETEK